MKRYAEQSAIAAAARRAATDAARTVLEGTGWEAPDTVARISQQVERKLDGWLDRQRTAPELVSRRIAAEIMGVQSPHVARYVKQGRMPEPLEVAGSAPVYIREEVEKLAEELTAERAEREAKRAGAAA